MSSNSINSRAQQVVNEMNSRIREPRSHDGELFKRCAADQSENGEDAVFCELIAEASDAAAEEACFHFGPDSVTMIRDGQPHTDETLARLLVPRDGIRFYPATHVKSKAIEIHSGPFHVRKDDQIQIIEAVEMAPHQTLTTVTKIAFAGEADGHRGASMAERHGAELVLGSDSLRRVEVHGNGRHLSVSKIPQPCSLKDPRFKRFDVLVARGREVAKSNHFLVFGDHNGCKLAIPCSADGTELRHARQQMVYGKQLAAPINHGLGIGVFAPFSATISGVAIDANDGENLKVARQLSQTVSTVFALARNEGLTDSADGLLCHAAGKSARTVHPAVAPVYTELDRDWKESAIFLTDQNQRVSSAGIAWLEPHCRAYIDASALLRDEIGIGRRCWLQHKGQRSQKLNEYIRSLGVPLINLEETLRWIATVLEEETDECLHSIYKISDRLWGRENLTLLLQQFPVRLEDGTHTLALKNGIAQAQLPGDFNDHALPIVHKDVAKSDRARSFLEKLGVLSNGKGSGAGRSLLDVEKEGIAFVLSREPSWEKAPQGNNPGYDLFQKTRPRPRCEVKAFSGPAPRDIRGLRLTDEEKRCAQLMRDDYYLYVVEYVFEPNRTRLYRIQDPVGYLTVSDLAGLWDRYLLIAPPFDDEET